MCTGNMIKTMAGDAPHCDADAACDEKRKVPNAGHTACGTFLSSEAVMIQHTEIS